MYEKYIISKTDECIITIHKEDHDKNEKAA